MDQVKDRGYSWVIMVAALFSSFIIGMFNFGSIPVLIYWWVDMFSIELSTAAWAPSVMAIFYLLTGPIISVLQHHIGNWKLQLLGVALSVLGCTFTALSTKFWHVMISFCGVSAFGSAMSRLASTDVIAVYFDKHKDKIFAASATSGLAGAMVAPVTLEYLYLTVSYKYTLLVLAATAALNLVPVLVYKDIRSCCLRSRSQESEDSEKWTDQNTSNDINNDELKTSQLYENGDDKLEEVKWIDERVEGETEREDEEGDLPTIKLHLQFLRQPAFLLVLGSCMLTTLGQNSFVSLAADYMIRKGVLTAQQAALGMSILGGATIVGSLMLTLASHWPLDRVLVTVVSSFTLGLIIVFTPLCKGITSAYPLLFAFGVFDSIALANVVSLISHEFGSDGHLMAKVSYMFMSMGMGSVIGPVIAGYLTTLTDGDIALYFLGSMSMCGAAILISYWLYKRFRGQPPNPSH